MLILFFKASIYYTEEQIPLFLPFHYWAISLYKENAFFQIGLYQTWLWLLNGLPLYVIVCLCMSFLIKIWCELKAPTWWSNSVKRPPDVFQMFCTSNQMTCSLEIAPQQIGQVTEPKLTILRQKTWKPFHQLG